MKKITLLGAAGSIGKNVLEVVKKLSDRFSVKYLSTHTNFAWLYDQAKLFNPRAVAISGLEPEAKIIDKFSNLSVDVLWGEAGLLDLASRSDTDIVVNALVGAAGMQPTLAAIEAGKKIALANKETLVIAGEIVMRKAGAKNVSIIPIDSEHSAIFQCLKDEPHGKIQRLIITASGGPFWRRSADTFQNITVKEALNHPNWNMGRKITIDSATMMNKGLELIEAHWLFRIPVEKIDVVIHPQSIIHSMVEFVDGSIKAQLGVPDMKVPIQYSLTYPDREQSDFERLDLTKVVKFDFHPPDLTKFRTLGLAREALRIGGTAPAVLNAANECAVGLFLDGKISFDRIALSIEDALEHHTVQKNPLIDDIMDADEWARKYVIEHYAPKH